MPISLSDFADQIQTDLADVAAATWTQDEVEDWLRQAIKAYSTHFPRVLTAAKTIVNGTYAYPLTADIQRIILVEYPRGETPPKFLSFLRRTNQNWYDVEGYYDVQHLHDDTAAPILILSDPSGGGTASYTATADHDSDLATDDDLTVPSRHHPILTAHVIWSAWRNLASAEAQAPTSSSSLLMSQHQQGARDAKRHYDQLIAAAKKEESESAVITWQPRSPRSAADHTETIY